MDKIIIAKYAAQSIPRRRRPAWQAKNPAYQIFKLTGQLSKCLPCSIFEAMGSFENYLEMASAGHSARSINNSYGCGGRSQCGVQRWEEKIPLFLAKI